jgi:hypothetical protein
VATRKAIFRDFDPSRDSVICSSRFGKPTCESLDLQGNIFGVSRYYDSGILAQPAYPGKGAAYIIERDELPTTLRPKVCSSGDACQGLTSFAGDEGGLLCEITFSAGPSGACAFTEKGLLVQPGTAAARALSPVDRWSISESPEWQRLPGGFLTSCGASGFPSGTMRGFR